MHEQPDQAPRAATTALALTLCAVAVVFSCQKIYDPDTWWHLATGRWVQANRLVPAHDVFSFATAGEPWIAHSWLADAGMAWLHGLGGPSALILFKAGLIAAGFCTAFLLAVRSGAAPWFTALALTLAVPLARSQFLERPQVVMFPLVALFLGLLLPPNSERRRSTWISLAAATFAWTNLHGSFLLGPLIVGALLLERAAWWAFPALVPRTSASADGVLPAAALFTLVTGLLLANPFGLDLPVQMLRDITSFAVTRTFAIEEHQPLVLASRLGFVAFTLVTGASFLASGRRARVFAAAVFLGFSVLAFRSVRFAAIAALVDAFVLSVNSRPLTDRIDAMLHDRLGSRSTRLGAVALALVLAAITGMAFRATFRPGREARFGLGVNESRFPGPTVQLLARSGFQGNVFNSWAHGGYLLWNLPRAKTLVDGRTLPAHVALLERLSSMGRPALDRWLSDNDVRAALLTRDDGWLPLFRDSPRFVEAAFDDRAILFLRKDLAGSSGAAPSYSYRFIRPGELDPSYLASVARGPQAAEAEDELRRAVAASPSSFTPAFLLAFFLEAQGKSEALDQYLAAARLSPGLAFAHYDLAQRAGWFALATGQAARVEPLLREALQVKKDDPLIEALLGTSLYVQKKLPEAEAALRRALGHGPEPALALTNLGYLYLDTSRQGEAIPLFERAVAAAPGDENAAYGLALALEASGRRKDSAASWQRFLAAFPSSPWAPKARRHLAATSAP